jgi:hypothetical protein
MNLQEKISGVLDAALQTLKDVAVFNASVEQLKIAMSQPSLPEDGKLTFTVLTPD